MSLLNILWVTPFSLNLDNLAKNNNDTIQTKIIYIFCTSLQIFILVERIEVATCLETMYQYLIKDNIPYIYRVWAGEKHM